MKKTTILQALIVELEKDLLRQQEANKSASAGATHSESRAETKWDTCGLEASYLARGHAQQFKALFANIQELKTFMIPVYTGKPVGLGALVEVDLDGFSMLSFLLPCGGGIELQVEGREVNIITPESPIGAALMDKKQGESFSFRAGSAGKIIRVD